jgi:hypothetical protein
MNNKEKKANDLFLSIGEIDDSLVDEAISYKRVRKKSFNFGALAACFALLIVLAVAMPLIGQLGNSAGETPDPEQNAAGALDLLFLECKGKEYERYESFEELCYVGVAKLVWQYTDSGEIYALELTEQQLRYIEEKLGNGTQAGADSPKLSCKVWILDGKGNVKTPYLKNDDGNVGCTVFDFEAEIIPNDAFVKCISDIMN